MPHASKPPKMLKLWMPRTHVTKGDSALSQSLQHEGILVLEHALQDITKIGHLALDLNFQPVWWVFTSAIAVREWAKYLENTGQTHLGQGVHIACVGQATANAVKTYLKRPADFVPTAAQDATYFTTAFNQHHPTPTSCLWVCSALAEDTVLRGLKAGGHKVRQLPLYEPVALKPAALEQCLQEATAFSPDVGLLSSPSNVDILARMGAFERVLLTQWICLGPRSFEAALRAGVPVRLKMLEHPTAAAIVEACLYQLND